VFLKLANTGNKDSLEYFLVRE
jgi:hypothetical protein